MKGNYLITTDNWFIAPDGKEYKAVWGDVSVLTDDFLGIKTNRNASNWYARVGTDDNHVIVAGCQIHYAVKCDVHPHAGDTEGWTSDKEGAVKFQRPTMIYIAK